MPESDEKELNLMKAALEATPPTSDDRLSPEENFISELGRRVAQWFQFNRAKFEKNPPSPRLFVLAKDTPLLDTFDWAETTKDRNLSAPDCLDNGTVFVCDLQCESSRVIEMPLKTSGDAVDFVTSRSIGDRPFAVLLADLGLLMVHEPGRPADKLIHYQVSPYNDDMVTLEDIGEALEDMHKYGTATHLGDCVVWENVGKKKMIRKAEEMIQGFVRNGLRIRFRSRTFLLVDKEVTTYAGRQDIRIYWWSPNDNPDEDIGLVIEMKVLRPTYAESANMKWLKEGVVQAHGYAESEENLKTKWVACYDARDKPSKYPKDIRQFAADLEVEIRQFVMRRTAH